MSESCDSIACKGMRLDGVSLPKQLLSPPYDMRTEMNWIDFSGIANPLGTPQSFIDAIGNALASGELNYPPDREAHTLRYFLGKRFDLSSDSFLVGTSISDMIHAVAQTFESCTVGIPVPCPAEYALAAENAGHKVYEILSPAGFIVPDQETAQRFGTTFDAAILANPGYPTSRLLPKPILLSYLETCSWVVVDERSIELTLGGESMVSLTKKYQNLIIVRSLCESFAVPGTPISYCIAHPETIAFIARYYDSSAVSMFAEVLSEAALNEASHLESVREFLDSEIPWLQCMLNLLPGVTIYPAEANYVLCTFSATSDMKLGVSTTKELTSRLQLAGFLIRRLKKMPGLDNDRYFCIAVRTRKDNEKLITALRDIIYSS